MPSASGARLMRFATGSKSRKRDGAPRKFARLACRPEANNGAIAQLGERVLCKHEVVGSIPSGSTILLERAVF